MIKEEDNIFMGDGNPYENLRNAIVYSAVVDCRRDYRKMTLKWKQGERVKAEIAFFNLQQTLNWFLSKYYTKITGYDNGKLFYDKIMSEIKERPETFEIFKTIGGSYVKDKRRKKQVL